MPIDTRYKDYTDNIDTWGKIRDAAEGQERVKALREKYLPKLLGQEPSSYAAYLHRAVFTDFTGRVIDIAIGQLLRKPPAGYEDIEYVDNINLAGKEFVYFSRELARELMQPNRIGVWVDYSEEQKRPYLTMFKAETIINIQEAVIDGIKKPTMIMLEGKIEAPDSEDTYKIKDKTIWKELFLDEAGYYAVRTWEKQTSSEGNKFIQIDENGQPTEENIYPVINDKKFDYIPFYIFTTNGISTKISKSPMIGMTNLNLAHYINSADYENMLHWTGARTIILRGWDEKKVFPIGGCATLDKDGGAEFLEASSDSALEEGMKRKEEQMAIIATSFISGKGRYVASAETATKTAEGEYATLADISNALSSCMTAVMRLFSEWMGSDDEVEIKYNTEFEATEYEPQIADSLSKLVISGQMSWETMFYNLKNKNAYKKGWTIEDEKAAIKVDQEERNKKREEALKGMYENNKPGDKKIEEEGK